MELHCDCAESPAAEQPSGKINKTAFKIFGKRKSGSAMPTIFGVKNKGDGKTTGKMGMVRSKTLDGLADAVLENSKKDEQSPSEAAAADTVGTDANNQAVTIKTDVSPSSPVSKSHSFFSLLKKNGKLENVKGENAEQRAGSRQKKGLKGLFNSIRWNRKDKNNKDDKEGAIENQPGLILSGSLTASLECIKEEIQKPLCQPEVPAETLTVDLSCEEQSGEFTTSLEDNQLKATEESPCSSSQQPVKYQDGDSEGSLQMEHIDKLPEPAVETLQEKKDENITGCGDIIADPDDNGGSGTGARLIHGNGKKAIAKKTPNIVAYQGGGEEMASPDQVDDNDIQDFLGMIPQAEEVSKEVGKVSTVRQSSREEKHVESTCDMPVPKLSQTKLKQVATNCDEKGDVKSRGKDQRDSVRNSDEGYWDSPIPGPEEEPTKSAEKKALSRDSCSGDALYDLYTEPEENTARAHVEEKRPCQAHTKPLSPVTVTCPVKALKDSKIPISIKHLPVHSPSQPAETGSNTTPSAPHHQPVKIEPPRTKIPVSKVLVRRVSNKVITGPSGRTALHEPARK
ncbi:APC membrane recruitment protein 2 [Hyla sarda]|uniref:APC membrane recruitment protein 2 n=1 Tax=Hyla sarda TaxID=327740 RepID=UPI0024C26177|nr:APC membrane recruitment protein 2 [Hyla sarda]